ncbi:MAG: SDR family oxidoreductase [Actinomycetia bacterium]|nr:SDR family oxidoreductase [Actinomycetes bacterium]
MTNEDRSAGRGASRPFEPENSVAIVTGAAGGIGSALVRALAGAGARLIVGVDLDGEHMAAVAEVLDAEFANTTIAPAGLDVSDRAATTTLVEQVEAEHGHVGLFCANAGIGTAQGLDADPDTWQRVWDVNVMAHVHAAAVMVPRWTERGSGHLLVTASAAGLLSNLGDAAYSTTKHAAVAFAEWVAITHGANGVGVTCLCPQGVRTPMVFGGEADEFAVLRSGTAPAQDTHIDHDRELAIAVVRAQGVIEPSDAANAALRSLTEGRFLALPHPDVAAYEQARAADHDRWITGMQKLQARLDAPGQ